MRIERRIGTSVAVLGSLLLALSGAVPALARSGPPAGVSRFAGLRFAATANATSTSFGGWVFGAKAAKSVTAEFKVPKLKCTSTATGIGPVAALLTGSSAAPNFNAAGLLLACSDGSPIAEAAVQVDGSAVTGTKAPAAGDLMKSTVTTSATKTTATIADLTKGHTFKLTKSGKGGTASQEGIFDDALAQGTTQVPVVNFGTISYSSAAISGKTIGSVKPQTAVNMQTKKKVLQILTGKITGAKKNSFTTTWKHS